MKLTKGNYLTQDSRSFPLDAEGLEAIQQNIMLTQMLGNIAGDKIILYGCAANGSYRAPGYVFLRTQDHPEGEVLYWEGGSTADGAYIKKASEAVYLQGSDYSEAYTVRSLAPGISSEQYSWNDFTEIVALRDIVNYITPLGVVQIWAGRVIPDRYMLCDGSALKIDDYQELYEAIGGRFGIETNFDAGQSEIFPVADGYFLLPNLTARFIKGSTDEEMELLPPRVGGRAVSGSLNGAINTAQPQYYTLAYIIRVK